MKNETLLLVAAGLAVFYFATRNQDPYANLTPAQMYALQQQQLQAQQGTTAVGQTINAIAAAGSQLARSFGSFGYQSSNPMGAHYVTSDGLTAG